MKLSIIIPAYNEEKNIKDGALMKVANYLEKVTYPYEVLIVDDGSTDKTVEVVEEYIKNLKNFRVVQNPHGGKAITVMSGLLKASGDIAVFTDMDQATPMSEIEKFFPKFESGANIVIGSRTGRQGAPLVRKLAAWGFSVLRTVILGLPIKDTQCGFKAFDQKSIKQIFPKVLPIWQDMKSSGAAVNAGFDVEVLFLAKKRGFNIAEVPVDWHHVGTERVQLIKDATEAIKDMLRIRINDLTGKYS